MNSHPRLLNRREFIVDTTRGAISLAAAATAHAAASNPFAYDLSRHEKTDPKLIQYEEAGRLSSRRPDPCRIGISPSNKLYIAAGKFVSALAALAGSRVEIALPASVRCFAIAKDGAIVVGLREHIEVFDEKGIRRASWDSLGKKAWLTGLVLDENNVFAADSGNRVIHRFDRAGKLLGRIGEKNVERNIPGLIVPSPYLTVRIHPDGLLRVNNPGRHQVEVYTPAGDFEGSWGKPSAAIDGFCGCCNPISLAILPDGRVVTAEKGLPRVKVYSADGKFESVVAGVESFPQAAKAGAGDSASDSGLAGLDLAVDSRGHIYILDLITGEIRVMQHKTFAALPPHPARKG